jgi:DNA repair photolyase
MRSPQFPRLFDDGGAPGLRDVAAIVRDLGIDGLTEAARRADQARYQEIEVRAALATVRGMPFRWALNPYRGCTHACAYCYARKYQRHLELGAGDDFSSLILVKVNLPRVLAREVGRPSWTRETVAIGTATDPYQPIEGQYALSRHAATILAGARTPFSVVTKGPMVIRDTDVFQDAMKSAGCEIFMSVPTVDERAWPRLEPGTAPPAQRLRAIAHLTRAGIDTGVLMMPLVAGITTSRSAIERTLQAIRDSGARFVGANVARFDPGVREYFFGFLGREYPHLLPGYERLYARTSARPDYERRVKAVVKDAAERAGVITRPRRRAESG